MNLILKRYIYTDLATIGDLYQIIDNKLILFCNTLELPEINSLQPKKICIPQGYYQIKITYSPKFKKNMPELINVPDRIGIRIHTGNTANDTDGCILVGQYNKTYGANYIANSKVTFEKLFNELIKYQENNIIIV
ncbi:MAG: DUF5675 family protein [Candidatus Aenigmatarchaeota archaeon]